LFTSYVDIFNSLGKDSVINDDSNLVYKWYHVRIVQMPCTIDSKYTMSNNSNQNL